MVEQLRLFPEDDVVQTAEKPAADQADFESSPDAERLRTENEELRNAIRIRDARDEMITELKQAGARSPGFLYAAVIKDLQFDENGKPVNTAALISNLKAALPEQFRPDSPASIDAGAGTGRTSEFLSKESLARMKPAEIAALDWNEVRRVLAS